MTHKTPTVPSVGKVRLKRVPRGETGRFWLRVTRDDIGEWHRVPLIVRRGLEKGPTIVLTAVVHGNELNGMRTIQELLGAEGADPLLRGAIVAVPVVNLSGYRRHERAFADGKDLNRFVKKEEDGRPAQKFAHTLARKLLQRCDCLLDLHTAGGGRRNVFYARVDLDDTASAAVAHTVAPQIIAHKPPRSNALRGFAASRKIPGVVLEIGDSGRFQPNLIAAAHAGILRVLKANRMVSAAAKPSAAPQVCRESYWIRARTGGAASLTVRLGERVTAGDVIGVIRNIWGDEGQDIRVSRSGLVIGMLRRPVVMEGSPMVHIGVEASKS